MIKLRDNMIFKKTANIVYIIINLNSSITSFFLINTCTFTELPLNSLNPLHTC